LIDSSTKDTVDENHHEQENFNAFSIRKKKKNEGVLSALPLTNKAIEIITIKFKNGFRVSSGIDFERFKKYFAEEFGITFTQSAEWLLFILSSVCTIFDDKYFIFDDEVVDYVCAILKRTNTLCININIFYDAYSSELYGINIFSTDMLKAFVVDKFEGVSCKWDYIYLSQDTSPAEIIRKAFNEREAWSFDELNERLPYIKMDTIKQTLNREDYFRVDVGVYTHIDNMDLPEDEGEKIKGLISERLSSKTYVIANELDLSKFEKLNPHCPFSAIRDAVFYKFLTQTYDKSGQVITRRGEKLRVLDILEQYCLDAETVSFEELNRLEASFDPDGRTHSQCLIAAHNTVVRVSDALFVAESKVVFDIDKIDATLVLYCQENFIPLKNIIDFSLLHYAGYTWNLFLLESYVRKYSRMFKFDVRAVNSANIGVIVKKSFEYDGYDTLLAMVLAKTTILLSDKTTIGEFLFKNGYIGWRNLGKNESKILSKAKILREGGTV